MPITIDQYYHTLGLSNGASIDEIKKAYRAKAKYFHPDLNKEPSAHQEFILVTEAYEYLINNRNNRQIHSQTSKEDHRKQARATAAKAAQMRYDEFLKSDYYKSTSSISALIDLIIFSSVCAFFLWLIHTTLGNKNYLFGASIFVLLIGFIALAKNYATRNKQYVQDYINALNYLFNNRYANYVLILMFNLFVYFYIGFATLIPIGLLTLSYFTFSAFVFILTHFAVKKNRLLLTLFVPTTISVILVINYIFSFSEFKQTHKISHPEYHSSSLLYLEDDALNEFAGIRFFWNMESIQGKRKITFTFSHGVLGWVVVKERQLY
jgi:hypothetical protein